MTTACVPHRALNRNSSRMPGIGAICRARHIVATLGGRYSLELGIEVDRDAGEIDRWALAATLLGDPSAVSVAIHTYRVLERAGVGTLADVRACCREQLIRLVDQGSYV